MPPSKLFTSGLAINSIENKYRPSEKIRISPKDNLRFVLTEVIAIIRVQEKNIPITTRKNCNSPTN